MGHSFERHTQGEKVKWFVLLVKLQEAKIQLVGRIEGNGHLIEVEGKCERVRDSLEY
jgi:hypothetical protein